MRASGLLLACLAAPATAFFGAPASAYECGGGFVPRISVRVIGDGQVVVRGRQVLLAARTGDCKNDWPIEGKRLEATIADDPEGTAAPLRARAEGTRIVWRADRAGVRYIRIALPDSRATPAQLVFVVTDPALELARAAPARIQLRPAEPHGAEFILQFLPANLPAEARAAWALPWVPVLWTRERDVATVLLPRGDWVLRGSPFATALGTMTMEGEGPYFIDRLP